MNVIYVYKITATQASGKQIDIAKPIAKDFFNISEEDIQNHKNVTVNVCHRSDLKTFNQIEIQSATNVRWSTTLNTYLNKKEGAPIQGGDLLVVERIMRSFCVWTIKDGDSKYDALLSLFDKDENSLLLTAFFEDIINNNDDFKNEPLQQIFYGAPGTGKSHIINDKTSGESVIRTTFHPDSDYSTFVGSYKPTTKEVPMRDVTGKIIVEYGKDVTEDRIVYEFVEQAFLQAYIQAWKYYGEEKVNKQFLVIEEINRGNCAQIFGDLFQLLDRNEQGFSDYPICADNDMRKQLSKAFADVTFSDELKNAINSCYRDGHSKDYAQQVLDGKILLLPNNLYIWATMNTSDQSLFPIDSAFKRRWDWEYMPIKYKNTDWVIDINGNQYSWVSLQRKVNAKILDATNSEDKMLGDYFVNSHDGIITEKMLLNKILFYLWNDVCKDGEGDIFKIGKTETVTFSELHGEGGSEKLIKMMEELGVAKFIYETDSNETTDPGRRSKPIPKYLIDGGEVQYTTPKAVQKIVQDFATQHTEMSVDDMINFWNEISERKSFLVASWEPSLGDNQPFANTRRFKVEWGDKTVWGINGWTEELFQTFIRNVNDKLKIAIEKVEE